MKRGVLVFGTIAFMLTLALWASQKTSHLLLLEWVEKNRGEPAPVAIVLEMGLTDKGPTSWPGQAKAQGAKIVHREGYRFQAGDRLTEPGGWQAATHARGGKPGPNAPPTNVRVRLLTIGMVFHLADLESGASLTISAGNNPEITVPIAELLDGRVKTVWGGKAALRRLSAATAVVTTKAEADFPAAAHGPDGTLWLAYSSYSLQEEHRRKPFTQIREQPKDFHSFYTPEFGDQLFVKSCHNGKWSDAVAVTGGNEDLVRSAIGVTSGGQVWIVYSANRQGNHDLFARSMLGREAPKLGPEIRITKSPGSHLTPALCTTSIGDLFLACQSWDELGQARISCFICQGGKWTAGPLLPGQEQEENRWYPALAAGPSGQIAVAYDVYHKGGYDVHVAIFDNGKVTDFPIANSPLFEARPSIAYDDRGRLWVAYEEGPPLWGKNFGALETDRGNSLYNVRAVRVRCLADGTLWQPSAPLPDSSSRRPGPQEGTPRYAYPKVGIDGLGRLWLTYRQKLPTVANPQPGSFWLSYARRLDGDRWSEPVEIHHSDGLLDSRPALAPHPSGGLWVIANTDGRYTQPESFANQIYASLVDIPGLPQDPKLLPCELSKESKDNAAEHAAVSRMRDYSIEAAGKKYLLRRGEFHRHTEISFDGGLDGSLEDMFRYGIDVAALDWIGNTDHDSGAGREYPWWLIQKYTDAYHVPRAFTPLFAYERSIPYPMGHRNCLFARRGIRTLPRLTPADPDKRVAGVSADDTAMLYRYLKELDGICASHTSATSQGNDWRDNDPVLEPVVEIYQGDRNSYEKEGAPRAGYDPKSGKKPPNLSGWFPRGYINLALVKGYRLGFQSSSDHISTHISYCIVLVEEHSREGVMAALRKRHCYGATDDIVVDVRSGDHLMGDEFGTTTAPTLKIRVIGAGPLERVDILKDSDVVETFLPRAPEYSGSWTDPKPDRGVHYYYVRVVQQDSELAWASPMWIDYAP